MSKSSPRREQMREFMLSDFWLLHKAGVSSFVENEGMWSDASSNT